MAAKLKSRLARKEGQRLARQTILIITASFILLAVIGFLGIPALIKLFSFMGDIKSSSQSSSEESKIPPYSPQIESVPEATSSSKINFSGFAKPATLIRLYKGAQIIKETTAQGDNGAFLLAGIPLENGENIFYTTSSEAGMESQPSKDVKVIYDDQPPALEISEPADNAEINGDLNKILTIKGNTELDSIITINNQVTVVNSSGSFSHTLELSPGRNEIVILATDKAGNITRTQLNVNFNS